MQIRGGGFSRQSPSRPRTPPSGASSTITSPRKRSFPQNAYRFYVRNSPLVFLTLIGTMIMVHWRLNQVKPGTEPPHDTIPFAAAENRDVATRRVEEIVAVSAADTTRHLSEYNTLANPVIPRSIYSPKTSQPLRVVFVGRKEGPLSMPAESSQHYFPADLFLDGLDRSDYIKVSRWIEYDPIDTTSRTHTYHSLPHHEPFVVIVDWAALSRDCHALEHIWTTGPLDTETPERENVYLLFLDLSGSSKTVVCPNLEDWVPKERTRIARRGITAGRHWDQSQEWVQTGFVQPNEGSLVSGGPILHLPYFLRETFVRQLETVAKAQNMAVTDLVEANRKTDVSHFWRKGDNSHYSFLRRFVSSKILEFDEAIQHIRWTVRSFGDGDALEVHQVDRDYVAGLVSSKIVVVAQKDEWEDHYRLMEALASGALVFSDVMVAAPAGLKNRTNIVFYDSANSFNRLLQYYTDKKQADKRLLIAQKGMEYALGRQRSWHQMESILFGAPLSQVDKPTKSSPERKHPPKTSASHAANLVATTL